MLRWSTRAVVAVRKLFEPLQVIDVYVEDADDEVFYRHLLNYASNGEVEIARVFGLGGRLKVIDAAASHDQSKRRALFIIDGDLEWVRGDDAPNIRGLHRLNVYCVENLLLCDDAIASVVAEETVDTKEHVASKLKLSEWRDAIRSPLLELFAAFATVSQFDPTVQTVSRKVGTLCSTEATEGKRSNLDPTKVAAVKQEVLNSARAAANGTDVASYYEQVYARLKQLAEPLHSISGKDFLLPLLDFHLHGFECRMKRKVFRLRIAIAGEVSRYKELATALGNVARGSF